MKTWPIDPLGLRNIQLYSARGARKVTTGITGLWQHVAAKRSARCVRKVTTGITGLWQPSVHSMAGRGRPTIPTFHPLAVGQLNRADLPAPAYVAVGQSPGVPAQPARSDSTGPVEGLELRPEGESTGGLTLDQVTGSGVLHQALKEVQRLSGCPSLQPIYLLLQRSEQDAARALRSASEALLQFSVACQSLRQSTEAKKKAKHVKLMLRNEVLWRFFSLQKTIMDAQNLEDYLFQNILNPNRDNRVFSEDLRSQLINGQLKLQRETLKELICANSFKSLVKSVYNDEDFDEELQQLRVHLDWLVFAGHGYDQGLEADDADIADETQMTQASQAQGRVQDPEAEGGLHVSTVTEAPSASSSRASRA